MMLFRLIFIHFYLLLASSSSSSSASASSANRFNSNKLARPCIYIGCHCHNELIRCTGNGDEKKLNLFPKRLHYTEQYPFNITFKIDNNELEIVPDDRFAYLHVHLADLSRNRLVRLSPDAFRDTRSLVQLNLSHNLLNNLNLHTFRAVESSLRVLVLNHNHLFQMETTRLSSMLCSLSSLESLSLDYNRLHYLPSLSRMSSLRSLSLEANQIETLIDFDTGLELLPKSLEHLNMRLNRLKLLNSNYVGHLASLQRLDLALNLISTFGENAFNRLRNLTVLNLSGNQLKHIPSRIFYTLNSLEHLDLSNQQQIIKRVDDYAFDRQSNVRPIQRIDLSSNQIELIDKRAFCSRNRTQPFTNIRELDLSFNPISKLNPCIMRQLAKGYQELASNRTATRKQQPWQQLKSRVLVRTGPINKTEVAGAGSGYLRCDCDITRSARLVDLDGQCELDNEERGAATMSEYRCKESHSIRNANDVNRYCMDKNQFDCASYRPHSSLINTPIETNDFYNSHLFEISDEDPYTTTTLKTTTTTTTYDNASLTNETTSQRTTVQTTTLTTTGNLTSDYESESSETRSYQDDYQANVNGNNNNNNPNEMATSTSSRKMTTQSLSSASNRCRSQSLAVIMDFLILFSLNYFL